ncbi:HAD family hydrolase [Streptomyces formicae]|uniref:HAD hydrolase-like protein n=1 Tax=Streptomyces formicae TaxID=1616117 RepID=A0ABY3WFI5_9ACTN|nr:HAD hydrolase-like protein [Streptomyces formicae]UNM11323.1 HAD hydrolase-like protein [Streptomyces formicae]
MQLLALFDLDNTLIDRQGGLQEWVRDFSAARALPSHAECLVADTLRERAYPADFERLRDSLGLADSVDSLWGEYVDGMASRARCRVGLHGDLRCMREAGWTLGVITNGAADIQRAKLESGVWCTIG